MFTIPTGMESAVTAIEELQEHAGHMEGQLNLLLGFVTGTPENREAFMKYIEAIANAPSEDFPEGYLHRVATMIYRTHTKRLSPESPRPQAPSGRAPGPNVIQFPSPSNRPRK